MAKNSVADWDTTAANNTDVGGIDINEGCPAANINNALRETMAQVKTYSGTVPALSSANTFTGVNTYTKIQKWAKGADVASASTLTLGDDGNYFDITGTTTITAIATKGVGTVVKLHFDASLTLTHHATDLILPGGANITTAAGDEFEFTEYATGDWRCTGYALASGRSITSVEVPAIPDFVQGLTLSNNATDANNDIDIATGSAKSGSTSVTNGSTMVKRLDASWASGTGNGGLDTGSKANSTWYYIWALRNSTTGAFDAIFSTSATSGGVTVPSGYTVVAPLGYYLGAFATDGSGNIRQFVFREDGGETYWFNPRVAETVAGVSTSAVLTTLTVPPSCTAICSVGVTSANAAFILASSTFEADVAASSSNYNLAHTASEYDSAEMKLPVDSSRQIRLRASAVGQTITINTKGYQIPSAR